MSDTPRTDDAQFEAYVGAFRRVVVPVELARQLERELATATACAKFPEATLEAIESLKRELAEARRRAQNAEGMADCMRMVRDELVEAGIIDAGVAPMFIPEAVAGKLADAHRLLSDIKADAQCAHWHKDIDAAMKAE